MNGTFRIVGGVPLAGEVTPIPNKNALMGALPAAALAGGGLTFAALPDTLDVHTYLEILTRLGATVARAVDGAVHVDPGGIRAQAIDPAMGRRLRGAFALTGPLLARLGCVEMPLPGGCELGYRAVTAHLDGFRKLGVSVEQRDGSVLLTAPRRHEPHYDIWLVEASVSATLALALYTAGRGFSVTIRDPACEPHVVEVLGLLRRMGVGVAGEGTNRLTVRGPGRPLSAAEFEAGPDFVDIAGSITAAAVTGGELIIRGGNALGTDRRHGALVSRLRRRTARIGRRPAGGRPGHSAHTLRAAAAGGPGSPQAGGPTLAWVPGRRAAGDGDPGMQELAGRCCSRTGCTNPVSTTCASSTTWARKS